MRIDQRYSPWAFDVHKEAVGVLDETFQFATPSLLTRIRVQKVSGQRHFEGFSLLKIKSARLYFSLTFFGWPQSIKAPENNTK